MLKAQFIESEVIKTSKVVDLTGKRFGKWTVIYRAENNKKGAAMWHCKCDCGYERDVLGTNLRLGRTNGCMRCMCGHTKQSGFSNTKQPGVSNTKIYKVWRNMKQRCFYEKDKSYKDYGSRGITVCDEWKNDFQAFYDYVSNLPHFGEKGYSLDRINNNGNYEPNNVRWATAYEQTHNRRKNIAG